MYVYICIYMYIYIYTYIYISTQDYRVHNNILPSPKGLRKHLK